MAGRAGMWLMPRVDAEDDRPAILHARRMTGTRKLTIPLLGLLGLGLLAGCGKKGPPVPPGPPSQITYPRTYPTH